MPLVARFEVALPEGLNRGQAGQTDSATGRVESDGGAELYTEAVDEFTQDAANPSPTGLEPFEQLEIKGRDLRPWVRSTEQPAFDRR